MQGGQGTGKHQGKISITVTFFTQYTIMHEEQGQVTENRGDGHGGKEEVIVGSFLNFGNIRNGRVVEKNDAEKGEIKEEDTGPVSTEKRAEACIQLEKKLKEIVMEDEESLVDIQEFLYYYSRLRTPIFIDIVDMFFAELFE
ncbi:hypothetical protein SUGI_0594240 [Cryptomeria japonica]|nr:hypothetical protein SUGI_0594240 [Cryptomeria japonica]